MKSNILSNLIIATFLAAFFSACAVRKPYARPELEMPAKYRTEVNVTADTILLPWKDFFKDPKLVHLIDKALEKNADVTIALKTIEQMELQYKQAKLSLLPTLDSSLGVNRSYPSKNSLNGSLAEQFTGTKYIDDFNAGLSLSWEADIWGKARMQQQKAKAEFFAQKYNYQALKTRLITEVASAYFNLINLDQQLEIAKENAALSERTLQMISLQYESGLVTSLGIEQATAQKKTAELIIPLAEQNILIQENALSILCGEYPTAIERKVGMDQIVPDDLFVSGVPASLLSRRPDVQAAEYNLISFNAQAGLAKAAMYPSFSLTAQAGTNSFKFNTWFDLPGSLTKNLAANLAQPIFQQGQLKTAYRSSLLEQEKASIQFRQTVMTAVSEVSDALGRLEGVDKRLVLTQEQSTSLKKATADATLLYQNGTASYLEVITAQNSKLQNDLELINLNMEKLNNIVELYKALGGGTDK
ncbi:efflux transporter, outer membrane factor (OMF) lipoprotein, NodT family [Paenimyroides ummariense]|uniref:Efflux transporter, outer membrane factor (OMF) lipoprotein, NodT family n=1 Tax=Paenimyroides ummariense TaxID=913024 RepID=A0A1I5EXZ5_9FLAO|nr:TolC family protein [Paenimyroides ummariense]SFO16375.1 efflux transporter, outer membrane factor (OMF) lipoprotein, NodT family [Paenimyroides ummariense]